ncbi:unnamed protein product [Pseudo-nitzschia multistriata]|uniref:Uncharacterized protein n=1 Tax=Pseudo-nitzschia multistriata TaxID=183589 RepID=A0A448Z4V0_9STRA|nr:unnamed protein product [Pseudo-nitzschia multistriata]
MVNNTMQERLARSRRQRSIAYAQQLKSSTSCETSSVGGGDKDNASVASAGSLSTTVTGNSASKLEERIRQQRLRNKVDRSRFSVNATSAAKPTKNEVVASPSPTRIANRRQRMIAISTKASMTNKMNRSNPSTPQTPKTPEASAFPFASSPCESSLYQSNEMEDYDGRHEPNSTGKITQKLKSFQRDLGTGPYANGRASPPPPPPPPLPEPTHVKHANKFKTWNDKNNQKHRGHDPDSFTSERQTSLDSASNRVGEHQYPSTAIQPQGGRVVVSRSPSAATRPNMQASFPSQQQLRSNRVVVPVESPYPSHQQFKGNHAVDSPSPSHKQFSGNNVGFPMDSPSPSRQQFRSNRVVVPAESPSSSQKQFVGGRVVVSRSPTTSSGSADSSYSSQQQKWNNTHSTNGAAYSRNSWSGNARTKVNESPKMQRSFSAAKFGSPHAKQATIGGRKSLESQVSMYKHMLKPVQKETETKKSHEKEAYGAIIETPEKSSVSSLHAMFNSQNATPLMPMNSTDARVRQSFGGLPSPGSGKSPSSIKSGSVVSSRFRPATETVAPQQQQQQQQYKNSLRVQTGPSASLAHSTPRSAPSPSPSHPVVASPWSQKHHARKDDPKSFENKNDSRVRQYYNSSWRVESPVNMPRQETQSSASKTPKYGDHNKPSSAVPSWQQRCKPRPIDHDVPDTPVRSNNVRALEPQTNVPKSNTPSSSSVVSFMYSQNKKPNENTPRRVEPNKVPASSIASLMYSQNAKPKDDLPKRNEPNDVPASSIVSLMYSQNNKPKDDVPKRVEPNDVPASSIVSLMYSQNSKADEETKGASEVAVDWPCDGDENTEQEAVEGEDVDETATDIIQEMLIDDISDVGKHTNVAENLGAGEMNQMVQELLHESSSQNKPWENDTKHSVVQTWQNRSSNPNDPSLSLPATEGANEVSKAPAIVESNDNHASSKNEVEQNVPSELEEKGHETSKEVPPVDSYSDSFIEEKKSGDLSIDEDKILGEKISEDPLEKYEISNEPVAPKNIPFYDDDSYISRGDTTSRGLGASESFKSASARSRTSATYNSEDMSVYVEDERIITKKEDKIISAQFEQMNLEVAVGEPNLTTAPALTVGATTPRAGGSGLPRLDPSPRDNDKYRLRYFEEAEASTPKANRSLIPSKKTPDVDDRGSGHSRKSVDNQVIDIWATSSASNDERDEAITFDETDKWLDCDPDIEDSMVVEDASVSSDVEDANKGTGDNKPTSDPGPTPLILKKPPQSLRSIEKEQQRKKATTIAMEAKKQPKQEVFDPFGIDGEEAEQLKIDTDDDLFSKNPDPFATQESFSPLQWSSETKKEEKSFASSPDEEIGYYNSPNSRLEI